MASWMIDRFGDAEQRARFLPGLTTMEHFASYCLTEPGAGSDAAALETARRARRRRLRRSTAPRPSSPAAGASDIYVVMVRTGDAGPKGISCVVVEKGTPGLSFGKQGEEARLEQPADRDGDLRGLPRAGRQPPRRGGRGLQDRDDGARRRRLNIAACSLGGARACLERRAAYMLERAAVRPARSPSSRRCSSSSPTWRPNSRRRG